MNYIQILYLCILKQQSMQGKTSPCQLWITFKSCIFAFWNNRNTYWHGFRIVVNYIQILYLCILKQLPSKSSSHKSGCELHSNLVSLHSETTINDANKNYILLWITFKSCIFAFWNNEAVYSEDAVTVVNYIQILYLCILKQPLLANGAIDICCELHSNLVSLHSETTSRLYFLILVRLWITFKSCIFAFWNNFSLKQTGSSALWITFKSCIFAFWNNKNIKSDLPISVVNYIQILYLCILKQPF